MDKFEYKRTNDYIHAKNTIRIFVNEALNGNIDEFENNDITLLIRRISDTKRRNIYFGNIYDPDMYYITQAIYIVIWGHLYNLTFDNMGAWGIIKHPFRGDTVNSFNSIFGKEMMIAKRYNLDDVLMGKAVEYSNLYHSIGNFIVIPNRLNVNSKRANYCSMQDYFDSFIGAFYQFKHPEQKTEYVSSFKKLKEAFIENDEYGSMSFNDFIANFFLEDYVQNNRPFNVFNIPYELRAKEYSGRSIRSKTKFVSDEEYDIIVQNYYDTSKKIIQKRAKKMIAILKNEID